MEELTRGRYSRLIEYKEEDTDQEGADQEGKKKGTAQEFIYKTLIENALITQSEMDKPLSEAEQVLADSNLKLSVKIGQPFTEKQQDLLERDIVWYVAMNYSAVTKKVTPQSKEGEAPPSGSTTIMVPVVYLGKETKARLKEEDSNAQNIIGSGQLLSISASKDGEIASYNGMFIGKDVVLNSDTDVTLIDGAGRLSGVRAEIGVHILANRDIIHEGGLVAGRNVRMFAGKNLRIATQLVFDKDGYSEANNLDYRDNAGKTHKVRAGSVLANKDKEDVDLGRLIQDIYNNIESKGGVVGGVYDVSEKHRSPRKRFKEIWFYNKNRVQDIRWEPIPAPPGVTNEVDRFYMLYNLMEMEDSFAKSFGYAELRNASDFRFEEIKALAKDKLDEIALYWKAIDTVENMDYIDGEKGTRAAQEVIENLLALIEYKKIALAPFITMVKEIKEGNRQKVKEIIKPLIDSTIANNIDPKHEGGILFNNAINSLKNIKALAEKNSEREGGGGESALESLRTLAEIKDKEGFLSSNAQKMIRNLSSIWSMKDMKAEDGSLLANIINTIQDLDDLSNMERSESPRTYEVIIHLKELKKLIEIAQGASSKIIDKAGASLQDISSEASPRKEKITQAMQLIEEWKKEGKSYIDKIRGIEESLNQRGTEDEASSSKLIEDLKSRDILDIEGLIAELEDLKTTSEDEKINQDLDAAIAGLQMMQIEEDARAETINTLLANLATLTTLDSPEQKAAKLSQMIASLEDLIKIKGMETLASMKSTLLTKLKKEKFIIKKEDIRASIKYLNSLEKNPEETEIATSRATLLKTMEKLEDLQLSLDKNRNEILVQLTELDNLNINKTGDTDKNTKEMLFYEKAIANIKNPVDFTPQQMITALEDLYKQDKKDKAEKDKIRSLIESLQSSLNMHSERNNLFREANSSVFMSNLEGPNTNPSKTFDLKNLLSLGTLFETANKEAKVKLNQALEEIQNIKEIQEKKIRTQNELIKIGNTTNINNLTEEEEARGLVKYMDIALEAVNQDWLKRMIKVLRHVKSERIKRYIREANTIDGVYELINSYDSLKLKPLLNKIRKSPALNNLRATLINIGPEIHGGGAASLNPDFMAQLSAMHYLPWGKSFLEILKPLANKNITENELNKLIEDLKRVDVYEINPTLRGLDIVGKIQTIIEASGLSKTATAKVIKLMEALDHSIKTSLKKTVQPLEEYIAGKHESVEDKVDQISKIVAALNQTLSIKEYELANKEEKAVKINRVINTLNSKIAKNEDDIIKLSNVFQALKRNISTNTTNLNELHEIDRKKALEDLKNSNEETVLLLKSLEEVLASNALDDKEEKTKEIINRLEDLKSAKNEKILVERNIIKNLRREHADDAKLKNILDNMEQISEIEEKEHLALLETLTRLKITNPIENPELKKAILYQSTLYEALEINNKNIYEKINKVLDLLNIIRDPELEAIQAEFQDLSNAEKIEDNTFQEAIKKKVGSWTETVNTKEMGGQELYDFLVKENNSFCSHRGARDYKECATAIYKLRDLKNGWAQRFEKNFNKLKEIVERKREEQIVAVSSPEKSKLIALSLKDFQNPEIRDAVKYLESLSNLKLKEEFSTVGKLLNFSPSDDDTVQRLISHLEKIANSLPDVLSSILGDLRKSLGERAGNSSLNISQEKVEKLKNQLNMSQEMLEGFDNQKDIDTFVDSLIVLREEKKNSTPYTQI